MFLEFHQLQVFMVLWLVPKVSDSGRTSPVMQLTHRDGTEAISVSALFASIIRTYVKTTALLQKLF